jgi:hypothetical protein
MLILACNLLMLTLRHPIVNRRRPPTNEINADCRRTSPVGALPDVMPTDLWSRRHRVGSSS